MNGKTNVTTTSNSGGTNVPHIPPDDFVVAPGDAKTQITWTDPNDLYAAPEGVISQAPYQLVSKWTSTKIVRSETDYPATPNDGILAVESNIRDEHKTSVFEDTNLNNGTVYYYSAFGMNEQGLYSQPSTQYAEVRASIPMADGYVDITDSLVNTEPMAIMCTQNHAITFGTDFADKRRPYAVNQELTLSRMSFIPQIEGGLHGNAVCGLNGYGFSAGGFDIYASGGSIHSEKSPHVHIVSPELTITSLPTASWTDGNSYMGMASTSNHVISYSSDEILAWTLDGTMINISTSGNLDNVYNTYGTSFKENAIFIASGSSSVYDSYYTDDLVNHVLNTNFPVYPNTPNLMLENTSANTPNHVIFHTGETIAHTFDDSFVASTADSLKFPRKAPQGITIGNYAMFIGGYKPGTTIYDDPYNYPELSQIQYYDISLTLNQSDSVYNPYLDPSENMALGGIMGLAKRAYQMGGTINNVGIVFGFASQGNGGRFYKFKLA